MKRARFSNGGSRGSGMGSPPVPAETPNPADSQTMFILEPSPEEAERLRVEAGLKALKARAEADPQSAVDWYRYGDALLALKRPAEALPALRQAVALSPDTDLFRYDLGLALYDLDQAEEAAVQFTGIVKQDPQLQCAWSNLGLSAMTNLALCQEKTGSVDAAVDTFLPAVDTAVGILFNLGFLNFRAKRYEAALSYARAAYGLRPSNGDIVHLYGALLSELGSLRGALKVLKEAVALNPRCAGAWYDLGLVHARMNQCRPARHCFRQSLQLEPSRPWSYYNLACLDALEGRKGRAFEQLARAVSLGFRSVDHLRRDTDLKSLRRDPRWKNLLRQLGDLAHANN